MYLDIGELTRTLHHNQCKVDEAFKLLGDLGYSYRADKGWYQESTVCNKPKLVTANKDLSGGQCLTKGRQYKVLSVDYDDMGFIADEDQYIVLNNKGVAEVIHKSHFYPVEKEDLLPTQIEEEEECESIPEWMEGFEDLARSDYTLKHHNYLSLNKLSVEQKDFLQNNLETFSDCTFLHDDHIYAVWHSVYREFLGTMFNGTPERGEEISFNDLFIPKQ